MRIRVLVLATLAPFLTDCATCCPRSPEEPFDVRGELSAAELNVLQARRSQFTRDPVQLTCDDLCGFVYERDRGWHTSHSASCTHRLIAPRSSAEVAAEVSCRGVGVKYMCEGRRPLGHVEYDEFAGDELGAYLARCAHLEEASVLAFTELAEQLAGLGAPAEMIARCRVAAGDERRHAQSIGRLAALRGATVPAPVRRECDVSLASIAAHNAVEGCVHEAWAAVGAAWTALRARDPELRAAYASIAADEAGHAQLAWDLHIWLIGQLDAHARAAVLSCQHAALGTLPRIAAAKVAPPALGLPGPDVLAAMASRFAAGLAA